MFSLDQVISFVFDLLYFALIIRVVLSWIPHDPYHPVVEKLYRVTDPILRPFQNIVPPSAIGGIDISPIFAFLVLGLVKKLLLMIL